jgi:hypothetical protein
MLGIFIAGKIRADNALAKAEIMQDKSDSISLVLLRDFLAADSLADNAKKIRGGCIKAERN